jgi:phosphatidylglycerol:prolipoprotein diacylglycerol transferase
MRPTLVSIAIGDHEYGLHTYGFLVGLGFAFGILRFWRSGRRQGLDGGRLLDLAFWSIVAGMFGSRLAFVLLNARAFLDACFAPFDASTTALRFSGCTAALRFWEGGLIFYGGVIASGGVVLWFCRRERWSFWTLGDLAAPTLALGHAIGRLGCFFAGCCFGTTCRAPWGVAFPRGSVAFDELQADGAIAPGATHTPALHPTQLYEAAGEFAVFALLMWLQARWTRQDSRTGSPSAPPGRLFLVYAAAYAGLRFVVELFRGDAARGHLLTWTTPALAVRLGLPPQQPLLLSFSQAVSLVVLAGVGTIAWRRANRNMPARRAAATTP